MNFLRADIAAETKTRTEIVDSLNQTLESDLPKLYDLIKSEASEREECDNLTFKKSAEEIRKLSEQISQQRK